MARQDNLLALSFHPELVNDFRIHKREFLRKNFFFLGELVPQGQYNFPLLYTFRIVLIRLKMLKL